ncbi:hypothetical protein ACTXT7_013271, partial [Hymenolepis weldensis]
CQAVKSGLHPHIDKGYERLRDNPKELLILSQNMDAVAELCSATFLPKTIFY